MIARLHLRRTFSKRYMGGKFENKIKRYCWVSPAEFRQRHYVKSRKNNDI